MTLSHFIYVSDISSLKGYSNPCGWFIGTWRNRSDLEEIITQIMISKTGHNKSKEFIELCKEFGYLI